MTARRTKVTVPPSGFHEESGGWVLPLPFILPLSLNTRMHWGRKARETAAWRDAGLVMARKYRVPRMDVWTVVLHYAPRQERTRDFDNLAASTKPLVDGIRSYTGSLDDHRHYRLSEPVIHPATGEPGRLWVVVQDLGEAAQ